MGRIDELILDAKRPLVWAGNGIRLAGKVKEFRHFLERTGLPCVQTWLGADLLPTHHHQNIGIVGVCGQRGANTAVVECDRLVVLGSSLSTSQTGAHFDRAKVSELGLRALDQDFEPWEDSWSWRPECTNYRAQNAPPDFGSYAFNAKLTRMLPEGTCMVVDGGGTALYTGFQSSYIKEGSRLLCSTAMSAMGSGLPEAVGACFANGKKLTTCIIGDGSLMLNVQELQTIATHKLPIKIIVINNGGYLAIRQTQRDFQEGRYYGVGGDDLQFPNLVNLARAFGVPYSRETNPEAVLTYDGPVLVDVPCQRDQPMLRQGFRDGKALPLTEMVIA